MISIKMIVLVEEKIEKKEFCLSKQQLLKIPLRPNKENKVKVSQSDLIKHLCGGFGGLCAGEGSALWQKKSRFCQLTEKE